MTDSENRPALKACIDRLVRPSSVALIGVSEKAGSLGRTLLANLESASYSGAIYLVNPKRPVINERVCLGSIDELPDGIDCAVLAVPGAAVNDAARSCAAKSVGSLMVFSAGFAESGAEGAAAQQELAAIARHHGIIVEGPNCLGMVNYRDGIPLTFIVTEPQPASSIAGAAIISQSGALAAVVAVNMRRYEIPLTYSISTGNEAVNGLEDFLEYLIGDRHTRVFATIAEHIRQPQRFLSLARKARAAGQYIVLLHPGRSNAARASAATHTGAMSGDYETMKALVTPAGVVLVESIEAFVDVTQLFIRMKRLPCAGAAVFTESGAFKALALDLCDSIGLELPTLSDSSLHKLREALPAFIPPSNPLDLTAQGLVDPGLYSRTLPVVFSDERIGSILLAIILTDAQTTQLKMPPILDALRNSKLQKPVVFAALDEGAPFDFPALDEFRKLGIPCFPSPERAIRALGYVTALGQMIDRCARTDAQPNVQIPRVEIPNFAGTMTEFASKAILKQLGITIPIGELARTLDEAITIACRIGFPVVMKAQSSALAHKSDIGAVALNLKCDDDIAKSWSSIMQRVDCARPGLDLDGMLVEQMASEGFELIVGARRAPEWGPILLVGAGGVFAEALRDVRLLPCDTSHQEIVASLYRLQCSAMLRGFRGSPPVDVAAAAKAAAIIGGLMLAHNEIEEIDINPLILYPEGGGVIALDALVSLANPVRQQLQEEIETHE
ncbi:MAG TPA: acetate--CoA ligase family protein [Terracidiphilus sp.]|nr:acetate--CoA ligase family protein [Terracidiphilus sp.]